MAANMIDISTKRDAPLSSISVEETTERLWDVIVCGAGPAGSVAARQIAQRGLDVLLVDKASFPRSKVCGCCLNGTALSALEAIGLGEITSRLSAPLLHTWQLYTRNSQAKCSLPVGAALSREALDQMLACEAIKAGASLLENSQATITDQGDEQCVVRLSHLGAHYDVRAKVVIAADGLSGGVASAVRDLPTEVNRSSRLGAGTILNDGPSHYESGTIYMSSSRGGYVGLVRLEDGRLDIAAALDREAVQQAGGPAATAMNILKEVSLPVPEGLAESSWRGTPVLTRRRVKAAAKRVFLIGDAAGYIEPFTGEGIAWALVSGIYVAPCAAKAVDKWEPEFADQWTKLHRRLLGKRQRSCRLVGKLLRTPLLADGAARLLRIAPWLARPLIRAINRPMTDNIHPANEPAASL